MGKQLNLDDLAELEAKIYCNAIIESSVKYLNVRKQICNNEAVI